MQNNSCVHKLEKNHFQQPNVLVIGGTPGVGKSTVSKLLSSRIGILPISISELTLGGKMSLYFDNKRETFVVDLKKIRDKVKEIIALYTSYSNKLVIIEGHYAEDVVSPKQVKLAIVLRRDPDELGEVLLRRSYNKEKIRENIAAEILGVCLFNTVRRFGTKKVCEVDATNKDATEVTDEIIEIIAGRKPCEVGTIDWLGKIESSGKLEEYLNNLDSSQTADNF